MNKHQQSLAVLIAIIFLCPLCHADVAAKRQAVLINGAPIICDHEAYNCPSYRGKYQNKRLKNCEDVRLVWDTCKTDVHGLDQDGDGKPCEHDCSF